MLTRKQHELLLFIHERLKESGIPPSFDEMKEAPSTVMASDCPLAAIQFEQAIGTRPIHPIQVLARAYRADGFETKLPLEEKK